MTFPDFIILGAAKAGTTALYHYLSQHPQIAMSRIKETNYFSLMGEPLDFRGPGDDDYINRLSVTTLEDYQAQFHLTAHTRAVGEASHLYLYHPETPRRIRAHIPHVKLIAILRNPVDRAFSAFLHLIRDGREPEGDFEVALAKEEERIQAGWEHIWHYRSMGFYYEQLKRYYDVFPSDQIRVHIYRDFRHDPDTLLREVFEYLGVDTAFRPDRSVRHNRTDRSAAPLSLAPELRAELLERFRPDILKLQKLLDRDLSHWLEEDAQASLSDQASEREH
jgi:hypothetical protein